MAVLPRSLIGPTPPGLVCVPVTDAPTSRLVLDWSQSDGSAQTRAFVEAATAVARSQPLRPDRSLAAVTNERSVARS